MMSRAAWVSGGIALLWVGAIGSTVLADRAADRSAAARSVEPVRSHPAAAPDAHEGAWPTGVSPIEPQAVVSDYCVRCHNDALRRGELSLETFEVTHAAENVEVAEKMIRKLQAGLMPPPGSRRPDEESIADLIEELETRIDRVAAARSTPGMRTFQRLNRPEYARAIKALLSLDVNAGSWLPLDTMSANFDNIADEQMLSATLLESYLNAAADISRLAIGDRDAPTLDKTYTNSSYVSQHPWDYIEGAPFGTRGGMVVDHVFPADAQYVFELTFTSGDNARFEDVDVSIDGERVALIRYETGQPGGADGRGAVPLRTEPIAIRAGQRRVAAAFVRRTEGPYEDLIRPHDWSYAGGGAGGAGITTLPHLRDMVIKGPYNATGVSETASRSKIFACRPTMPAEERPCARRIVSALGHEAYRRALTDRELGSVMQFYDIGVAKGGFEEGVRTALEAILSSPLFLFRLERQPGNVAPGDAYLLADADLASRLSFFLWGTLPDDELRALAARGGLSDPAALEAQARRMLADPRAEALGRRFAAQWLRLQDVDKVHPDPNYFPNFDSNLAALMKQETILFFNDLVGRDGSLLDLYRADYTFLNERLARHYGLPGVAGPEFRRVTYPDDRRRGLLGQGTMLVQSSLANRTSPVLRGKWVMEVLMGTPPPPPPPNIPLLDETGAAKDGKILTTRERIELHAANPTCNACHRFMDPIGLALDKFDVTGKWREREAGMPLDTSGTYYDGSPVSTPAELSALLLKRPVPLARTFAENLMSYALGRRVEVYDQPTVRAITREAAGDEYRLSSFILGVVTSDAFRMKQADPISADARR